MSKPLYIDGLTQEQRTRYVRCSALNGQTLNEWAAATLDREAARLLAFEYKPKPTIWQPPAWAEGLSQRAVEVLRRAGINSREAVSEALTSWTPATWFALQNCSQKTYAELKLWHANTQNKRD